MIPTPLQEQIEQVLELDERRTQGEWSSNHTHEKSTDILATIRSPHLRKGDFRTVKICDSILTNDGHFAAQAPQMAQLIRKLRDALVVADDCLKSIPLIDKHRNKELLTDTRLIETINQLTKSVQQQITNILEEK